jgi:hypothetical protein
MFEKLELQSVVIHSYKDCVQERRQIQVSNLFMQERGRKGQFLVYNLAFYTKIESLKETEQRRVAWRVTSNLRSPLQNIYDQGSKSR